MQTFYKNIRIYIHQTANEYRLSTFTKKPDWLKKSLPKGGDYQHVRQMLSHAKLHTVCQEAACPNMFECFSNKTSTFMILGSTCTRNCQFCNIEQGPTHPPDPDEPNRIAKSVMQLGLTYVVVTSVTRDDLPDQGADQFVKTIQTLRSECDKALKIEVLIPDFQGDATALKTVLKANPDVLNHNLETIESLYPKVRPQAVYKQSLDLLKNCKRINKNQIVKSGIMVGLGESFEELNKTMQDIFNTGCDILTIGQYLQPTREHLPVIKYYTPKEFKKLEKAALKIGFKQVAAGPFVRSSYKAKDLFQGNRL